jgi:hypothetical protein
MQVQKSSKVESSIPTTTTKPKPNYKYLRDKDRELVRGKFIFHEVPGGLMSFVFKKWKEDPVERYDLWDGEIYSIPLGVAVHLNKNCFIPIHSHYTDENGKPSIKVGQKVRRCSFQSLEFVDIEDLTPDVGLLTVEYLPKV